MAASTSARTNTASRRIATQLFPVAASTTIYGGCYVSINSSGYAILTATTASSKPIGLASSAGANNSAGSNGDIYVEVQLFGPNLQYIELDAVSPAQSWVGGLVYFTDDHTAATSGSNSIVAGTVIEVLDTTTNGKIVVDVLRRA